MKKYIRLRFLIAVLFAIPLIILLKNIINPYKEYENIKQNYREPTPIFNENKEIIKRGSTISDILKKYGFSNFEIFKLISDVKDTYNLQNIKAGNEIKIFTSKNGEFNSLEYAIDEENYLQVVKQENSYKAWIKEFQFLTKIKVIHGKIKNNLLNEINKLGEEDYLGLKLAELFGWDIDFYTDLREGDEFIVIFEKKYLNRKFLKYGNILAATFKNKGKEFKAIRYVYPDTKEADYFTPEGKSVRKEFLRSPLKYGRITSRFSFHRFHPILKKYRPHYGVDYSAPLGTPVQATADGIVTFAGRKKGEGKMIKIKHKNYYETLYLHLSWFKKGIRRGVEVKQGEVIGYVGSTGLSTGPHLDYRIKYRGKYINPLVWKFKPAKPVKKEYLEDFKKKSFKYIKALDRFSLENNKELAS